LRKYSTHPGILLLKFHSDRKRTFFIQAVSSLYFFCGLNSTYKQVIKVAPDYVLELEAER